MKKTALILITALMLLSLCSCGGAKTEAPAQDNTQQSAEPNVTTTPDAAEDNQPSPEPKQEKEDVVDAVDEVYAYYDGIVELLIERVESMAEAYNAKIAAQEGEDRPDPVSFFYLPFFDIESVDAVYFADGTSLDTIKSAYEISGYENVSVESTGYNEYTVSYDAPDYEDESIVYRMKKVFKAVYGDEPCFAFYCYKDDVLDSFIEYKALGNDRYALMDMSNRAIVSYKDGAVTEALHAENIYDKDWETGALSARTVLNAYPGDSIWERGDISEDWVTEQESQGCIYRLYNLSGSTLTVTGLNEGYDYDTGDTIYTPGYSVTIEE